MVLDRPATRNGPLNYTCYASTNGKTETKTGPIADGDAEGAHSTKVKADSSHY